MYQQLIASLAVFLICSHAGEGQIMTNPPPPSPPQCGMMPQGYMPQLRPPGQVTVNITLELMAVYSLDRNILTAAWDALLVWQDMRLENPCGETVVLPSSMVWLPDIVVYNAMTLNQGGNLFDPRFRIWLDSDGTVNWEVFGDLQTRCQQDLTLFPFDRHDCTVVFSSESYCSSSVNYTATMPCIVLDPTFPIGSLWTADVLGAGPAQFSEDACSPELTFRVRLSRRPIVIVVVVAIPVIILLVINVATFCLPPGSGEKVGLAISVFWILVLFFAYGSDTLPIWSSSVPLLVVYVVMAMVFAALSVLASVFVVHMHFHGYDLPPPRWLLGLSKCFGGMLCVEHGNEVGGCCSCCRGSRKDRRRDSADEAASDPRDFRKVIFIASDGTRVETPVRSVSRDGAVGGSAVAASDLHSLAKQADEEKSEHKTLAQWSYVAKVADRVFFILFVIAEFVVILAFLWWYPAIPSNSNHQQ